MDKISDAIMGNVMRSRETVEAELELNKGKCIHYATKEWDVAWFHCAGRVNELQDELAAIIAAEKEAGK